MAEGRSRALWGHTSAILTILANAHRDPKRSKAYVPDDFNPHVRSKSDEVLPKVKITSLKDLFIGPHGKVTVSPPNAL